MGDLQDPTDGGTLVPFFRPSNWVFFSVKIGLTLHRPKIYGIGTSNESAPVRHGHDEEISGVMERTSQRDFLHRLSVCHVRNPRKEKNKYVPHVSWW